MSVHPHTEWGCKFSGSMPLPHVSFAIFCPHSVGCLSTFPIVALRNTKVLSVSIFNILYHLFPIL